MLGQHPGASVAPEALGEDAGELGVSQGWERRRASLLGANAHAEESVVLGLVLSQSHHKNATPAGRVHLSEKKKRKGYVRIRKRRD